jgi:hypothetical protein
MKSSLLSRHPDDGFISSWKAQRFHKPQQPQRGKVLVGALPWSHLLMMLQVCHLFLQLGYPHFRLIIWSREPLSDERGFCQRILLNKLQKQDRISLSFIQNESTQDSGARPIESTTWPRAWFSSNIHLVRPLHRRSGARHQSTQHESYLQGGTKRVPDRDILGLHSLDQARLADNRQIICVLRHPIQLPVVEVEMVALGLDQGLLSWWIMNWMRIRVSPRARGLAYIASSNVPRPSDQTDLDTRCRFILKGDGGRIRKTGPDSST